MPARPVRPSPAARPGSDARRVPQRATALGALLGALAAGCFSRAEPAAPLPERPPTPGSITLDNPGGDSSDPEAAALRRQLELPWEFRLDRDDQLRVPLPDAKHQKRVRYWAIDHFTGFRYGADFHVMNVVLVHDVPEGERHDDRRCQQRAEKWAFPQMKAFEVKLGPATESEAPWRGRRVPVKSIEGHIDFGLTRRRFSGAYAAYAAFPGACLVFGVAVPWGEHEALARAVRDRWVREAVPRLDPLTKTRPYRK